METPLVSIIVPVYNTSKYLRKCLDSIVVQTYENTEIILVDDGSTDESRTICEEYAKKDRRIKVVYQENEGQASARNHGMEYAHGMYISYIDSDDYVENNYIKYMVDIAEQYNADLVHCCMEKFWKNGKQQNISESLDIEIYTASEALNKYCYQNRFTPSPCCKLIHSSLFENLKFPVNMGYEDAAIMYKVIGNARKLAYIKEVMYYYRQHNMSTMHTKFSDKKIDRIRIADQLRKYIETYYPENIQAMKSRYLLAQLQLIMDIPFDREYDELRKNVKCNICGMRGAVIKDKKAKKSIRAMACISYGGIYLLMCLGRIYKKILM